MLATQWRDPFSDDGWLFEPKWDGIRVILSFDGETTTLRSRHGNDITARFPELRAHGLDGPPVVEVTRDAEGP